MIIQSQLPFDCEIVARAGFDAQGRPVDSEGNVISNDSPPSATSKDSARCNYQQGRRERTGDNGKVAEISGKFTFAPSQTASQGSYIQLADGSELEIKTGSSITFQGDTFKIFSVKTSTDVGGTRMMVSCEVQGGEI